MGNTEQRIMSDEFKRAREILKNGILDGMSVEKLIQMTNFGLSGNVEVELEGICGTNTYFNCMEYVQANNSEECDIISFLYKVDEDVVASTTINIENIESISGCVNDEHSEDVLNINILMVDETEITIYLVY